MRPSVICDNRAVPLWQSHVFATALRHLGTDAAVEPMGAAGEVLIIRRKFGPFGPFGFASRGPVWASDSTEKERIAALRDIRLHIMNAQNTGRQVLRSAGFRQMMASAEIAILGTHGDLDEQLAQCSGKWRNAYRKGVRSDMDITHRRFSPDKDCWVFAVDRAAQKQKGYRALPPDLVHAIAQVDPQNVTISLAKQRGTPIAAMMFLRHGSAATYHVGWTSDTGRKANAHHVMLMQAAKRFARLGVSQIELGQIDRQRLPGLARFKLGAGAQITMTDGTWIKIPFL